MDSFKERLKNALQNVEISTNSSPLTVRKSDAGPSKEYVLALQKLAAKDARGFVFFVFFCFCFCSLFLFVCRKFRVRLISLFHLKHFFKAFREWLLEIASQKKPAPLQHVLFEVDGNGWTTWHVGSMSFL